MGLGEDTKGSFALFNLMFARLPKFVRNSFMKGMVVTMEVVVSSDLTVIEYNYLNTKIECNFFHFLRIKKSSFMYLFISRAKEIRERESRSGVRRSL